MAKHQKNKYPGRFLVKTVQNVLCYITYASFCHKKYCYLSLQSKSYFTQ